MERLPQLLCLNVYFGIVDDSVVLHGDRRLEAEGARSTRGRRSGGCGSGTKHAGPRNPGQLGEQPAGGEGGGRRPRDGVGGRVQPGQRGRQSRGRVGGRGAGTGRRSGGVALALLVVNSIPL